MKLKKYMRRGTSIALTIVMTVGISGIYARAKDTEKASVRVESIGETKTESVSKVLSGIENAKASIAIEKIAGYDSGVENADGGTTEIVQYNRDNKMYYIVNGQTGTLDIVPRQVYESGGSNGEKCSIKTALLTMRPDFIYGDMTSVSVNTKADLVAVAVQAKGTNDKGVIVLMNFENEIVAVVDAGVQPDMVIFDENGDKVLSANEGEPREGYAVKTENNGSIITDTAVNEISDPMGTITIADISNGVDNITTTEVTFEKYDSSKERQKLIEEGVIIKKETNPSVDFEPEYITVMDNMAYVSLQEANAIAVIDINKCEVMAVNSLGFKNHNLSENALDLCADGVIGIKTENVYGIYMPDAVSSFKSGGLTYILTANEGDSREWGEEDTNEFHCNELKTKDINGEKVVIFDKSEYEGLDDEKTYIFGGRSFSIFRINKDGSMEMVYDSGSEIETIIAKTEGTADYFNSSNDDIELDSRSGKKGPEVESITVGEIGEHIYAFVGLERVGGIVVYDVTNPEESYFVNYINTRDFTNEISGDVAPEGMVFIPAGDSVSGNAELIVAYEVSGTVGIYEMKETKSEQKEDGTQNEAEKEDANVQSAETETNTVTEKDSTTDKNMKNVKNDANILQQKSASDVTINKDEAPNTADSVQTQHIYAMLAGVIMLRIMMIVKNRKL